MLGFPNKALCSLLLLGALSSAACVGSPNPTCTGIEAAAGRCLDGGAETDAGTDSPGEPPELAGIVSAHNDARASVDAGLPPLTWDPTLADIARAWAAACQDETEPAGFIDHNSGRSDGYPTYVGENLFGSSEPSSAAEAVAGWMAEQVDYDYAANACSGVCGHYTQVVWKNTTRVGCAAADCPGLTFRYTVVCNYAPGGNLGGQRPY